MIEAEESNDLACLNTKEKNAQNSINQNFNPKAFTTKRNPNKKSKTKTNLRIADSMLFSIDELVLLNGLFEGEMTHLSFDCPKNLRSAFNNEAKHNSNSVCKLLQQYMSAYVTASLIKKNALSNTQIGKTEETNVSIGALNFTQIVQNRPRRLVNHNPEAVVNDVELDNRCQMPDCPNESKEDVIYQPKGKEPIEKKVCGYHASEFIKTGVWRLKR